MIRCTLPESIPSAQIAGAGLLWGTTGIAAQVVHRSTGLSAVGIGFYRLAIAAAVLLVLAAPRLRALLAAFRDAPVLTLLIGVGLGAYHALFFCAVAMSGVAVATVVCLGLAPLLTAGWEAGRSRRLPGFASRWSLVAAVTGVALIGGLGTSSTGAAPRPLLGVVAAAGSGVGYAVTTVLSRHVAARLRPVDLTAMSVTVGGLVLAPVAVLDGGIGFHVRLVPAGLLVYLGVVTTAVAYALFYAGLRTTSESTAAILTLLEPLAAALLAVVVLDEPLTLPVVAGGVLLLGAVLGVRETSAGGVDRAGRAGQAGAGAAPAQGDDLGPDADRGLLGRAGAQIQADRGGQPGQLGVGGAGLAEPGQPVVVGAPGTHRPHVRAGQSQSRDEHRDVELGVVGEHTEDGPSVDPAGCRLGGQVAVGPVDDHLVGGREAGRRREHRPCVADRDPVAEERPDPGYGRGVVGRPEDEHPRWRHE
jgi:drug/metabolite transporter (DMT)-like permease